MIKVGGATEIEVKERKDRVDDALHATRAAVEEGIVPGGGVALLRAIKALETLKSENEDQKVGIQIVRKALQTPARQIFTNAGEDGSVIVGKILENSKYAYGYNAQSHEYGDLVAQGVIDPTKVVRCALQDAASVAGLLITTEAMIAELPKKDLDMRTARRRRRHGRDGLLSLPVVRPDKTKPRFRPGLFCLDSRQVTGSTRREPRPGAWRRSMTGSIAVLLISITPQGLQVPAAVPYH